MHVSRTWRWLAGGACLALLTYLAAAIAAERAVFAGREERISRDMVSGRAAAALDDSGRFVLSGEPTRVHPALARADAESAAVAQAYWFAPTRIVLRRHEMLARPAERRHVCSRSYYVRPVVALPPDSISASSVTGDFAMRVGPMWVVPICDDAGVVRTTTLVADAPTRLRVILGDQPGDVPELVYPRDGSGRVVSMDQTRDHGWQGGISLMPESAVAVAAARLAGTGARVTEPPEAFAVVIPPDRTPRGTPSDQAITQGQACPRWRLVLDRPVTLRGVSSGQVLRSTTVYVARGDNGCEGAPTLQIPRPVQPATLPFSYGVRPGFPRDTVLAPRNGHPVDFPPPQMRSIALRVTAPVWFEEARP